MSYNYKKLLSEIPDETHAAKFLQKVGIIHRERLCCGVKMRPIEEKNREKLVPLWRCISCKRRKGIRVDTWLDPSKLPLDTIVEFIYWWSRENTSMKFCEFELGMNYSTTVDWSMFMREVCANSILQHQGMIGGPGFTIEIDESLFSKRLD
jgi:hypothetical protein